MKKSKKQIILLTLILIGFISLVIVFAHSIYFNSKKSLAEQFSHQQLMLANEIAKGIGNFFVEMEEKLELLASFSEAEQIKQEHIAQMKIFYEQEKGQIRFLGRIDKGGNLKYFFPEKVLDGIEKNYSKEAYFVKAKETHLPFVSMDYQDIKRPKIVMITPVTSKRDLSTKTISDKGTDFDGIVMFEIRLDKLIETFILHIRSGKQGYAWLLDEKGVLLSHIKHPEMINKNIFVSNGNCFTCHTSFALEKKMIKGLSGAEKYSVKGGEENFIAYAPIHLKNHLWSVGIVAPASEVEELVKVNLRNTLILVIFIISCFSAGAFLIIKINEKRILLEEKDKAAKEIFRVKTELQAIFDGITDGIALIDSDLVIRNVNKAFAKFFNKTQEEITGRKCHKEFKKRDNGCIPCLVEETFKTGKPSFAEETLEDDAGNKLYADITAFPLRNEKGEMVQIVEYVKDTTEQRKMKIQIEQSERLATIGTFASGLAHEVRNPLNSINLQLTLLERRISKIDANVKDETTKLINIVRKEISELNRLVEDFLMLSRSAKMTFVKGDINDVLEGVLKLIELEARVKGVLITRNYNEVPQFLMDPGKLKEVFLNLIHNSLEAMPSGGKLVVSTYHDNGNAVIRVKDTGIGIKDGKKIFDVFYSTKDDGTGLGLPIAHRIIEDHRGAIDFESKPGEGTIFTVIIPIKN